MNKITFLVGIPGSGKTTYANNLLRREESTVRVNRDEIRFMLTGLWFPGDEYEPVVSSIADATINAALKNKMDVVVDNTNCNRRRLKEDIQKWSKKAIIDVEYIGKNLTLDQIKERNRGRDRVVPENVLDRMWKGFNNILQNPIKLSEMVFDWPNTIQEIPISLNIDANPKAIIVDLDGTIAHHTSGRSAFEWHRVGEDSLDNNVARIIKLLSKEYMIIFVSGRSEVCREQTAAWLIDNGFNVDLLYMRKADDYRKDSVVKKEIFTEIMRNYYIEICFDDRDQVVEMARKELGLKVAQVAYGDF